MQHEKMRRRVLAAMFAAITAVTAQLVIPLGFTPVPFTLALIAIFLTGALLDPKTAFLAQLAYLLIGAAGAPVFSYFSGGRQKLAGPTGGYLLAYPFMALTAALFLKRFGRGFLRYCAAMLLSLFVCYTLGTLQLIVLSGMSPMEALPFAVFDIVKAAISAVLASALYRALGRARLLAAVI